jgi:hypothetical protein
MIKSEPFPVRLHDPRTLFLIHLRKIRQLYPLALPRRLAGMLFWVSGGAVRQAW